MSAQGGVWRFEPPARLRDVIDSAQVVWRAAGTREVLLPDGHGVLLVAVGVPAVLTNPLTGGRGPEQLAARGPTLDVHVRETSGPGVCMELVLTPVGLARLWDRRPARGPVPATALFGAEAVTMITDALTRGDVEAAVGAAWAAAGSAPRHDVGDGDLLAQALAVAQSARGVVRPVDLAHEVRVPASHLHRWCVRLLGVDTQRWLSAVRFATFVRESVGPGLVRPDQMAAALRWYIQAGYSPRETERFTGLPGAELRRLAERLDQGVLV